MIGLKELALVAVVVLVLYGRTGVVKSRQFQTILPWISPLRHHGATWGRGILREQARPTTAATAVLPRPKPFVLRGNRLFWFLTILAATAVAAWIVTRVIIVSHPNPESLTETKPAAEHASGRSDSVEFAVPTTKSP